MLRQALVLTVVVACGKPAPAPAPSRGGNPTVAAAAQVPASVASTNPAVVSGPPRPASRTPSSLSTERWRFEESNLEPAFELVRTAGRPGNVFVTPDARHMVLVANDRSYEVRSAKLSTAGTRELAWPYARISPGGTYVALVEALPPAEWELGSNLLVVRLSDHATVTRIDGGADPIWIDDSALAFRVGNQAKRLDLPGERVETVGPAQTTHGCPNAALRGYTRVEKSMCPGGRYSRVLAVDAHVSTWLVVDDDGTHETALRLVDLASGRDRVLADRRSHGFPLYVTTSPRGTRYCLTPKQGKTGYELHCGRFPEADDQTKVLEIATDRVPITDWLDEDRLLVTGVGIIDLAKGKQIELDANLSPIARLSGTFGPRYVVADMGWVFLLDLDARTSTRLDVATGPAAFNVFADAAAAGRLWVTKMPKKSLDADVFELRLVPK